VRLIRAGTTLEFLGRHGDRLATLAIGVWPLEAVRDILGLALARLPIPSLPWRDAEGARAILVDKTGLVLNFGIRNELVSWEEMVDVNLVMDQDTPRSPVVLRTRVTKRDGSVFHPGLSRTNQIVLYQVLIEHGRRILDRREGPA
jgi:hypothetical protein